MDEEVGRMIDVALDRCEDILRANLFEAQPFLAEAVFVLLMINLKDALSALSKLGHRIAFDDDLETGDITDLVHTFRNAVCHLGSHHRRIQFGQVSFCRMFGRGTLGIVGDLRFENPYPDDIAFFYGTHRILLRRHIVRATTEARDILTRLAAANDWWIPPRGPPPLPEG